MFGGWVIFRSRRAADDVDGVHNVQIAGEGFADTCDGGAAFIREESRAERAVFLPGVERSMTSLDLRLSRPTPVQLPAAGLGLSLSSLGSLSKLRLDHIKCYGIKIIEDASQAASGGSRTEHLLLF